MAVDIDEFKENLGKLRRNETQMSPEQKKMYAKNLQAFKKRICKDASDILSSYLTSGMRFIKTDDGGIDLVGRLLERIRDEEVKNHIGKKLGSVLLRTYSLDAFLESAVPLHNRCWYEAYGVYWVARCKMDPEEKTYYNPIIDMYWHEEYGLWVSKDGCSFTIMLPPTEELLKKAYEEEKERYAMIVSERGGLS